MAMSNRAKNLIKEIDRDDILRGELKKHAKKIKKDHKLAMELWSSGRFQPRLLATLIFDKKELTQDVIDQLVADMQEHDGKEPAHLSEWFMANQLMKDKRLTALMESWQDSRDPILRRLFWYHQARLRWMGQESPENTDKLMKLLEQDMVGEEPLVQWAMNFCAGWIGVHDPKYRKRCISLGKKAGLFADEVAPKNCTPNYLPEFIRIETAKRAA